jgi:hypothetical protein
VLASNLNPPNLHLPNSHDNRLEPPHPDKFFSLQQKAKHKLEKVQWQNTWQMFYKWQNFNKSEKKW